MLLVLVVDRVILTGITGKELGQIVRFAVNGVCWIDADASSLMRSGSGSQQVSASRRSA